MTAIPSFSFTQVSDQPPSPAKPPPPIQPASRPLPQPAPRHQPQQHQQQPPPTPIVHHQHQQPSQSAVDPNLAYYQSLVKYYWDYALQGYSAPAESDIQITARNEAVGWARQQGITVLDPPTQPHPQPQPVQVQVAAPAPAVVIPQSQPQPLAQPTHPRHDPSHPSHALYHPTSTTPSTSTSSSTSTPRPLQVGEVVCFGCQQTMFGRVLTAMNRPWHPDCFVCMAEGCEERLEHIQFEGKEETGEVYCMLHYEELFALKCFHCHTPIADSEYITINDPSLTPSSGPRTYHPLHFFCASCGDPFVDPKSLLSGREGTLAEPYIVVRGHAYCQKCDVRLYKPKCKGCKKGIAGDLVEALGKQWHGECFVCQQCSTPLSDQYFVEPDETSNDKAEKAYCNNCYDQRCKQRAWSLAQQQQ